MKTIYFSTTIAAPAATVQQKMLDRENYRKWTTPFSPSSDYKGTWAEGNKLYFTSLDESGNEMGLISQVERIIPGELVIFRHLGIWDGKQEEYDAEKVGSWKNSLEIYRFQESNGSTQVTCSVELGDEEPTDGFDKIWAEALAILKQICES